MSDGGDHLLFLVTSFLIHSVDTDLGRVMGSNTARLPEPAMTSRTNFRHSWLAREPLVLIDGVRMEGSLAGLRPEHIERIEVTKGVSDFIRLAVPSRMEGDPGPRVMMETAPLAPAEPASVAFFVDYRRKTSNRLLGHPMVCSILVG